MENCLFCKIVAGEIPSNKVYEDDRVLAFRDIAPQAPVHILVIPKEHIPSAAAVTAENSALAAACLEAVAKIADQEHLDNGFRQTVPHLHFHILAGKPMGETMV